MGPIKCSDPNCTEIMDDPCPPITALFGLRMMLESQLKKYFKENDDDEILKGQLEYVKKQLQNFEIQNEEEHYETFKLNQESSTGFLKTRKLVRKVLVLECNNKHRKTYIIDCEE